MNPSSRRWLLAPALVAVLLHAPIVTNDLVWDDRTLVAEHPQLEEPGFVREAVTRDYGLEFGRKTEAGYYRPAFVVLLVGIARGLGRDPAVYHAISIVAFGFLSSLLAWTADRLFARRELGLSVAAGCLFAVHPLNTELNAFFHALPDAIVQGAGLLMLLVLLTASRGRVSFGIAAGVGLLAGLTKEAAFSQLGAIAAALALVAGFADGRRRAVAAGLALGAPAGLAVAFGLRLLAGIEGRSIASTWAAFAPDAAAGSLWGVATALRLTLLPVRPVFDRIESFPPSVGASVLSVVLFLAAGLGVVVSVRRGRPGVGVLLAWVAGGLFALVFGMAEGMHFAQRYVPTAPLLLLGAIGVLALSQRFGSRVPALLLRTLFGILLLYCATVSVVGGKICRDSSTFWEQMLADQPRSWYPRTALASGLLRTDDGDRAEELIREAMGLAPEARDVRLAAMQLAAYRVARKEHERALPFAEFAARGLADDARPGFLQAVCQFRLKRFPEALEAVRRSLAVDPNDIDAIRLHAAVLYYTPEVPDEAIVQLAEELDAAGIRPPAGMGSRQEIERGRLRALGRILPGEAR